MPFTVQVCRAQWYSYSRHLVTTHEDILSSILSRTPERLQLKLVPLQCERVNDSQRLDRWRVTGYEHEFVLPVQHPPGPAPQQPHRAAPGAAALFEAEMGLLAGVVPDDAAGPVRGQGYQATQQQGGRAPHESLLYK